MPGSALPGQGDLFGGGGWEAPVRAATAPPGSEPIDPRTVDDRLLLEKLPLVGSVDCSAFVDEAVRRQIAGAVPALDALCRRFKGFGMTHPVREQTVALAGLAAIGGPEAAATVQRLINDHVVAEPGLSLALKAAARLRVRVPPTIVHDALNAREPDLRASACRCARFWPAAIPRLIELLEDLNHDVARDAAIALGVAGRCEAVPSLVGLVMQEPTNEVIEALVTVGSDECFVALGRVADVWPDLRHLVIRALAASDHRLATTLLRRIDPDHPMIVTDER
ncbi:hypothetical protein [Acidiphilium acidophilum]|uniref:HEAT repeat domain-containing protein n=1 Tax=Acidiphilium acidophilum TaxID=76588 RepID=UPI002E8E6515|nr:hypothetical protein [Acidiphilium acidophilum]